MNEERFNDDLFEKADGPGLSVVHLENPMAS